MSTEPSLKPHLEFIRQFVFWSIHAGCLFAIWTGVSWIAALVCVLLYFVRMFGITGGFHRYFSHRSFRTSRAFQFILAYLGSTAAQKGPIWWASHHRHHHRYSDTEEDIHPPRIYGVWWAHMGWVVSPQYLNTRYELVKDLLKFPELRLLEKYNVIAPLSLAFFVLILGYVCEAYFPGLNTTMWQMFIWGFCISTTLLYHGTFSINSLAHLIGKARFKTGDDSRNSFILALITMGEGWHNNHHRYPGSERQGMYWWEIDMSHYVIKFLSWLGLVWDVNLHPERIYKEAEEARI